MNLTSNIKELHLSCNLDTFYNNFIADDAAHSIPSFQKDNIGDYDIEVTSWQKTENEDGNEIKYRKSGATSDKIRTVTFTHPLSHTMGPSSAKTKKVHRFQRFGSHGSCLEIRTNCYGIPAADCFYLEERWLFESKNTSSSNDNGDEEKEGGITMRCKLQIYYVKSTMFRGFIDKNTKAECKSWCEEYGKMLQKSLQSEAEPTPSAPSPSTTEQHLHNIQGVEKKYTLCGINISKEVLLSIILVLMLASTLLVGFCLFLHSKVKTLEEEMNAWRRGNIMLMQEMRDILVLLHYEAVGSRSILQNALSSSKLSLE
mmetsp:Transcript_12762/g.18604  ORF Transcript_12762/g.18604 Transcript_12762/m.18604 type:complete len:314 (+) Transcript_12762:1080-2021(+)